MTKIAVLLPSVGRAGLQPRPGVSTFSEKLMGDGAKLPRRGLRPLLCGKASAFPWRCICSFCFEAAPPSPLWLRFAVTTRAFPSPVWRTSAGRATMSRCSPTCTRSYGESLDDLPGRRGVASPAGREENNERPRPERPSLSAKQAAKPGTIRDAGNDAILPVSNLSIQTLR